MAEPIKNAISGATGFCGSEIGLPHAAQVARNAAPTTPARVAKPEHV
jgi:hypothetical protein